MIVFMYCLRDRVSNRYYAPTLEVNNGMAMRNFGELLSGDTHYRYIAKDLDLYLVGKFEYETGRISVMEPSFICNGLDCLTEGVESDGV